ncbi:MAG: LysM peptidoglycan-binding domain-containing protein [Patescibacteria group bacterium]|nr:LysM peptidoglycan-binding domain-containing protein [Patescibacteria group bacterium]
MSFDTGVCISNSTVSNIFDRLAIPSSSQSAKWYRRLYSKSRRKSVRRQFVRAAFLTVNLIILGSIGYFVTQNPQTPRSTAMAPALASSKTVSAVSNPLDQLSSADIALTIAKLNNLPETTAITNQADSQASELRSSLASDTVVDKPQVVLTALKSKADIKAYKAVDGDTISSIATKFGVTSDSIRWSNNLTGDAVTVGASLTIPPVNGIVHTVVAGDTADSLATTFKANKDQIVAYNDAEINGLKPGEKIIVPNGTITPVVPVTARTIARVASVPTAIGYAFGSTAMYGSNGYDYGYCTWYVANRISVPSNWGNANTWDNLAPLSGWTVSSVPRAGAIGQSNRGAEGHVAVIEAVSDDATMIKYSDMNGLAGYGRVGYSEWVSAAKFENYIYR